MRSRWILVQHEPMRPCAVGIVRHQEPVELDPVGGQALPELFDGPRALFGVAGEGPVVRVDPGLLVASRHERPGGDRAGRRDDVLGEREGDPHLEQVALGDEAQCSGECRRRPAPRAMAQRWTGAPGGASATARRIRADASAGSPPPARGRGVDDHVEHGGAVAGREEEGAPGQPGGRAGQDDASFGRRLARTGDGEQLGLGQRRVIVGRSGLRPGAGRAPPGPDR